MGSLGKKFSSPRVAEAQLEHPAAVLHSDPDTTSAEIGAQTECKHVDCGTQLSFPLSGDEDLVFLSRLYSDLLIERGLSLPDDFLTYCIKAMQHLSNNNRSNVVYKLVKGIGIGTIRSDGSDSCFPCKRMPTGLLQIFFQAKTYSK